MLSCLCTLLFLKRIAGEYLVSDAEGLGRELDGIGGLSGGGATSKLLQSYPEPQRSQVLDFLFLPNFGASLQILKVEIGGDDQSTDGSESSHMHEPWEENYRRGYEWWLMTEAKKRNPGIKLWGLAWTWPGWLGSKGTPWANLNATAAYLVNWIRGAKLVHGLDIDYIGIWNERSSNFDFILTLRALLDKTGFGGVGISAPDTGFQEFGLFAANASVFQAIYSFGVHYPGTESLAKAVESGKRLWSSEDYSTFDDDVGAGCWARLLNRNYVNGYMTSTVAWNLVSSYYPQLPYTRNGLMDAFQPWSGRYTLRNPIWITAHTTQFSELGWRYLKHGSGVGTLRLNGTFVALTDPSKRHLTIVVEAMAQLRELQHWETQLNFGGRPTTAFESRPPIQVRNGVFTVFVNVDSIHTFTTLTTGRKGSFPGPLPVAKPFPIPYSDDYQAYEEFAEPKYLAQQVGAWEVLSEEDGNKFARQTVMRKPVNWCSQEKRETVPFAVIGNGTLRDIVVAVDVRFPTVNASEAVMIGARVQPVGLVGEEFEAGGCGIDVAKGALLWIHPGSSAWRLTSDLAQSRVFASGSLPVRFQPGKWYHVFLRIRDERAWVGVGGWTVGSAKLPVSLRSLRCLGTPSDFCFAALGSQFGLVDFDHFLLA